MRGFSATGDEGVHPGRAARRSVTPGRCRSLPRHQYEYLRDLRQAARRVLLARTTRVEPTNTSLGATIHVETVAASTKLPVKLISR